MYKEKEQVDTLNLKGWCYNGIFALSFQKHFQYKKKLGCISLSPQSSYSVVFFSILCVLRGDASNQGISWKYSRPYYIIYPCS